MNLLFYKEGFSYCVDNNNDKRPKVTDFKVSGFADWEDEICKELELNLSLRRNFKSVRVCFVSSFFSVVPQGFMEDEAETLLNFAEAEFDDNILLKSETVFDAAIFYGTSRKLIEKLKELYSSVIFCHSGQIFLDSLQTEKDEKLHLNLNHHNLEIAVTNSDKLIFYNLFDTPTGEDILFYTLFAMEQLGLDSNKIEIKTYGELLANTKVYQLLKKYVRHVNQALKDEFFLNNFTLYNLTKCELSQVPSREEE